MFELEVIDTDQLPTIYICTAYHTWTSIIGTGIYNRSLAGLRCCEYVGASVEDAGEDFEYNLCF